MDANSREATQAKIEVPTETTAKPSEMLYCIRHEATFKAELGVCGLGHVVTEGDTLDFCCFEGGYAFTPPDDKLDDLPEDWASQPAELSDEELAEAERAEQGMWLGGME